MKHLSIDIETYSSVDIGKAGAYRYAQSEDFEVLLFAYKADETPTEVVDLASGEVIPDEIVNALRDPAVTKHAYNAAFEWYCLNRAGLETPIEQWECTMVHGLYCGYPAGLEAIGKAIGLPEDKQKLATGKALIRYFCSPCKPTKSNGGRVRNLPVHAPEKWKLFVDYNRQDVETEYAIQQRLNRFPMPESEWEAWREDIRMNADGVRVDTQLIEGALMLDSESKSRLLCTAREIAGLDNPNSSPQMLSWLKSQGVEADDLQKATVAKLLDREDLPEQVRQVLRIRQQLSRTSVKKYVAMQTALGEGDRIRGLLQFYGAGRSGRWAGRLVQCQNLPRNYISTLDSARELVRAKNYDGVKMIYGDVSDTLSQLIRTAFVPSEGGKLIVSDFSAIEARVIAWLAKEDWVLDVFRSGGDIYCATASQMFGVPVEKHGINGELRQKGKVATLALGYQGGANALIAMGALNMGIPEEELPDIVAKWRNANPRIRQMWYDFESAAVETVRTGETHQVYGITFRTEADLLYGQFFLTVELPSGRKLFYCKPYLKENQFGKSAVHHMGINQNTRKWEETSTYGGKLVENVVQAIARDCLEVTLERVRVAGYRVVMHIHDEIVIDARADQYLKDVNAIFAEPIPWAPGLPLNGDGFESPYYKKD